MSKPQRNTEELSSYALSIFNEIELVKTNDALESSKARSSGNPFIDIFPLAVEFKIQYLIEQEFCGVNRVVELKARQKILDDNNIEEFLYPRDKTSRMAHEIFQALTEITAMMAFVPQGIEMFGWHFVATVDGIEIEKLENYGF